MLRLVFETSLLPLSRALVAFACRPPSVHDFRLSALIGVIVCVVLCPKVYEAFQGGLLSLPPLMPLILSPIIRDVAAAGQLRDLSQMWISQRALPKATRLG